ncbi:hypothetical protein TcBrA4_0004640 [Trypanosoma cruzi]|nr:hypothetical protein TcBrA4_0004640 [Trypanosoma cruzi]
MTSNDINAFKQYLCHSFSRTPTSPSGGRNGGPPARRLQREWLPRRHFVGCNCRRYESLFLAEGEITQRECLKRMDSERFREEVWEEMISAENGSGTVPVWSPKKLEIRKWNWGNSTWHLNGLRLSHHAAIFRAKTIGWNIFIAVLLLRLSNSLHLRIETTYCGGAKSTTSLGAVLSVQGSCVASKVDGFASYLSQVERRPVSTKKDPQQPSCVSLWRSMPNPAPRRSSASGSFFTSARIKTSLHDKASGVVSKWLQK